MFPVLYLLENRMHRKYITLILNEDCGSFTHLGDARNSNSEKAAPHNPTANHCTEHQGLGPPGKNTFSLGLHNECYLYY